MRLRAAKTPLREVTPKPIGLWEQTRAVGSTDLLLNGPSTLLINQWVLYHSVSFPVAWPAPQWKVGQRYLILPWELGRPVCLLELESHSDPQGKRAFLSYPCFQQPSEPPLLSGLTVKVSPHLEVMGIPGANSARGSQKQEELGFLSG